MPDLFRLEAKDFSAAPFECQSIPSHLDEPATLRSIVALRHDALAEEADAQLPRRFERVKVAGA